MQSFDKRGAGMGAYGPPLGFYRNNPCVHIDPMLCTACVRCMEVCPRKGVIGIEMISGKRYAKVKNPGDCAGCGRCVEACLTNAIGLFFT
ncbi:hypothetical protein C1878_05945 [Gordonibacter sp. 28C]|uniref:4Fe-4S binding protein n=1 Tax=Gordonibacter sp. 28C TaxID=2078569 RepID=UPI000DF78FB5|nr:hypothetical protein C1878_05945 [Gordonibacter sp. 28C]